MSNDEPTNNETETDVKKAAEQASEGTGLAKKDRESEQSGESEINLAEDKPMEAPLGEAKKTASWGLVLVLLMMIGALGVSGFAHWWQFQRSTAQQAEVKDQQQQLQQQFDQQGLELKQAQQTLQQAQTSLRNQLTAEQSQNQQRQAAQQVLAQQLDSQNQRLLKLSSVNSQNWELAEALYLSRLAGQRLMMESNSEASLALLMGAEEIIARQQNPKLFSVREAMNNDIAALKVVDSIDKEGLFLQLSAVHRQIQNLPITEALYFEPELNEFPPTFSTDEAENKGWWRSAVNSFEQTFQQLDGYVRKVDLEAPIKPLLAPEQQDTIRLSVNLYIESAQVALLRGQTLVFKNALGQAQQILSAYYPESNQRTELILALESLQAESINPTLPDISQSYVQLNDFIQQIGESENSSALTGEILTPDTQSMETQIEASP